MGLGFWRLVLGCRALFKAQPDMNEQGKAQIISVSTLGGTSLTRRLRAVDRAARCVVSVTGSQVVTWRLQRGRTTHVQFNSRWYSSIL